ncbi:MAG TPA: ABC transporter permease [Oscillospiraceae bacterium]|nr:ABC transporter permease [Oscillospiraceae bacterium]HRW56532.1 ABC transporter permease [Oscillospiraceae bacterium]
MRLIEILRMVFINLVQNKSKVALTSLGIIVGSATIVLVIAIGQGSKADVADQYKNLNAGAIDVSVSEYDMSAMEGMGGMGEGGGFNMEDFAAGFSGGNMPDMGGGMPSFSGGSSGGPGGGMTMGGGGSSSSSFNNELEQLDTDDVEDIESYVTGLDEVTILVSGDTTVYGGNLEEETTATVVGVQDNYQSVSNLELFYGDFISEENNDNEDYVCVIGYSLATDYFTYPQLAYGDYLTIDEKNYEIIGVLQEMGSVSSGISPDTAIYVPYATAEKYIFGSTADPTITAVASDVSTIDTVMADIDTILTENHPNSYFDVSDAGSLMEAATSSANTLSTMLLAVASIVFVVGGIGIMNVLFVTVKERTEEIGVLKAIGCSNMTILMEFVLEAVTIGVIGGILGVAVSFAADPLLSMFDVRLEPTVYGYLLAIVFAILTGTVFGFYPAYKASKLVPVEALSLD